MSTLTSILSTDLLSDSRQTINDNFNSLNAGKPDIPLTASVGGTGQTTYTTGDILVALNSSTLTKLGKGSPYQALTADPSQTTGLNWLSTNKIAVSNSSVTVGASVAANTATDFLSVTIPGSVLTTNTAIRTTVYVTNLQKNLSAGSVLLITTLGGVLVTPSVVIGGTVSSLLGKIENVIACDNLDGANAVKGHTVINLAPSNTFTVGGAPSSIISGYVNGVSGVNTSANVDLKMRVQFQDNSNSNGLTISGYVVEKIT